MAEADWRFSVFDWRVVAGHGWVHAARHTRGPLAGRARHWAGLRSGASGVRAADGKAPAGGPRRGSAQAGPPKARAAPSSADREPSRFATRRNKPECSINRKAHEPSGPLRTGTVRGPIPSLMRPCSGAEPEGFARQETSAAMRSNRLLVRRALRRRCQDPGPGLPAHPPAK